MTDTDKAALREMAAALIPTSWREAVQRALAELDAREKQAVSEAFVDAIRQARIEAAKEMRERAAAHLERCAIVAEQNDIAITPAGLRQMKLAIEELPIEGEGK